MALRLPIAAILLLWIFWVTPSASADLRQLLPPGVGGGGALSQPPGSPGSSGPSGSSGAGLDLGSLSSLGAMVTGAMGAAGAAGPLGSLMSCTSPQDMTRLTQTVLGSLQGGQAAVGRESLGGGDPCQNRTAELPSRPVSNDPTHVALFNIRKLLESYKRIRCGNLTGPVTNGIMNQFETDGLTPSQLHAQMQTLRTGVLPAASALSGLPVPGLPSRAELDQASTEMQALEPFVNQLEGIPLVQDTRIQCTPACTAHPATVSCRVLLPGAPRFVELQGI